MNSVNKAKMLQLADYLETENLLSFEMEQWFYNFDILSGIEDPYDWVTVDLRDRKILCGTAACGAGSLAVMEGVSLSISAYDWPKVKVSGDDDQYIDEWAAELLGFDEDTANIIFVKDNWPYKYSEMARCSSDRTAFIELLRDIVEYGVDVVL